MTQVNAHYQSFTLPLQMVSEETNNVSREIGFRHN